MNKKFLTSLALAAIIIPSLTSCSDDDDNISVDAAYAAALTERFPNVGKVDWENKGGYTVADFKYNGFDTEAWFDNKASWLMTETDYERDVSRIPAEIASSISTSDYATWTIDDIDFYERKDISFYVIEVEKDKLPDIALFYSPGGDLIKTQVEPIQDILPTTPILP